MSAVSGERLYGSGGHRPPLQFEQLELAFDGCSRRVRQSDGFVPWRALSGRLVLRQHGDSAIAGPRLRFAGQDVALELKARELLRTNGAGRIASNIRVEWNPRLKSCAGHADYHRKLISLNPQLHEHGLAEIDRTLRHELAHLLAQFRAGRRRIFPHGSEWRAACVDLEIGDEKRCHFLPFPIAKQVRRFLYKCPNCQRDFARVRPIRRAIACLACCRAHNGGEFDPRFRLRLCSGGL
jgi:predicted SprT family Zn-dependent metalloprotease